MIVGCGAAPTPSATSVASADKPMVVIQSPADGAQLPLGQDVAVSGAASDSVGVDHVELFVDGVSVASTPPGLAAALLPFNVGWLAAPAGPHNLQAVAYRQDGTASDPASVSVNVGTPASAVPSGPPATSTAGVPTPSPTGAPTPTPTPKPTRTPRPTRAPTPTPTVTPPTVTPDPGGNAPDDIDNEPYEIVLNANNKAACPPIETGAPVTAVGCIWEQISAPAGDMTDDLEFTQAPNTTYHLRLTFCSDASDTTLWSLSDPDPLSTTGCMDSMDRTSSGGNPGSLPISVFFGPVGVQTYNLYQFTVYQCQFANCKTH